MNIVLWVIQIILSIKLITVSITHGLRQSSPTMQKAIQKAGKKSRLFLYLSAVCTLLGTAGLILPGLWTSTGWITPFAAAALSILLLLSILFHTKCREKPNIFVSIILFILAAFVAYGRWVLFPL